MSLAAALRRRRFSVLGVAEDEEEPPPVEGADGPGAHALAWADKTTYPTRIFSASTPIPAYPGLDAAGYGWNQGVGAEYEPQRVSYTTVTTPWGSESILDLKYPGTRAPLAVGASTVAYPYRAEAYTTASVRIEGDHSGSTFNFLESLNGGSSWSPVSGWGYYGATSGSSGTTNGVWGFSDPVNTQYRLLKVERVGGEGTAIVTVGFHGGQSPARGRWGDIIAGQRKLYIRCAAARITADWLNNGVTGTKWLFPRTGVHGIEDDDGNNHYLGFTGGNPVPYVQPSIGLQPHFEDATPPWEPGVTHPAGSFLDIEVAMELNTPGVANGVGKIWVNGVHMGTKTDIKYLGPSDTSSVWKYLWGDPTFGGGVHPGVGASIQMRSLYLESAP